MDRYNLEIPADKLREAIAAAYELSRPAGMGFLHFKPGPLPDADIDSIVAHGENRPKDGFIVCMDYVHGRGCKFEVYRDQAGRLFICNDWFDHTSADLLALLEKLGVEQPIEALERARSQTSAAQ
jgi:hypothetical protein